MQPVVRRRGIFEGEVARVRCAGVDGGTRNNYLIVNSLRSTSGWPICSVALPIGVFHGALAGELGSRFVFETPLRGLGLTEPKRLYKTGVFDETAGADGRRPQLAGPHQTIDRCAAKAGQLLCASDR